MDKKVWVFLTTFALFIFALFLVIFNGKDFGGNTGLRIKDEGIFLPIEESLNFIGTAVTCVDDFPTFTTDCTITGGAGGVPGGDPTQLQFNDSGAFGGIAGSSTSLGNVGIGNGAPTALLTLGEAGGITGAIDFLGTTSGTVSVTTAAAAGTWALTLPVDGGTSGYFLQTDGAGVTTWAPASGSTTVRWDQVTAPNAPAGFVSPAGNETNLDFQSTTVDAWTMQSSTLTTGSLLSLYSLATSLEIVSGTIDLPNTTTAISGVVTKAGDRFLHNFALGGTTGNNLFLGVNAGNFTMTGSVGTDGSNNTGIGSSALAVNTTGSYNVAVGPFALQANISGANNTAIGGLVLSGNTTGNLNAAVGHASLAANTTGSNNIAVGPFALSGNIGGLQNVGVGTYALLGNTSGSDNVAVGSSVLSFSNGVSNVGVGAEALIFSDASYNTAVGARALRSNLTGNSNTAVGGYAGYDITTGSNNVILGAYTTLGIGITTGSNNVIIGQDLQISTVTASNQLNVGNLIFATGLSSGATYSGGNVGIGNSAPSALLTLGRAGGATGKIDLLGTTSGTVGVTTAAAAGTWTLTLPTSGGTSGYFLQTNGSGVTTWAAGSGGGSCPGGANTQVQYNAAGVCGGVTGAFTADGITLELVGVILGTPVSGTLTNTVGLPLTTGVVGILPLLNGGTNAALTANNGGIFYSNATAGAILAGTATAGQIIRSGASSAPSWSTATYPATSGTTGFVLTSDGTNWISAAPAAITTVRWDQVVAPNTTAGFISPAGDETTLTFNATTQTAWVMQSSTLTTGKLLSIVETSTDLATGNRPINTIAVSGAHANGSVVVRGLDIYVTNSGTASTNVALDLIASGASTNHALQLSGGNVNVASATTILTPSLLTINAHTLGGTVSGGANQVNNVIIGTVSPLAGFFTDLSASGYVQSGASGGTTGIFYINGTTSGAVGITAQAAAGTWSLTLPTTGGTNGYLLQTNGSGVTTWVPMAIRWDQVTAPNTTAGFTSPAGSETTLTFNATTQTAWTMQSSTLTTGKLLNLVTTSTALTTGTHPINTISVSGAHSVNAVVVQGLSVAVTTTGTLGSNTALVLAASGATTANVALDITAGLLRTAVNAEIGTTLQIGAIGGTTGLLNMVGTTSGTVGITTAAAAGTWTLTLPTNDGASGEALITNGSGVTSWGAVPLSARWDQITAPNVPAGFNSNDNTLLTFGSTATWTMSSTARISNSIFDLTSTSTGLAVGSEPLSVIDVSGIQVANNVNVRGMSITVNNQNGNAGSLSTALTLSANSEAGNLSETALDITSGITKICCRLTGAFEASSAWNLTSSTTDTNFMVGMFITNTVTNVATPANLGSILTLDSSTTRYSLGTRRVAMIRSTGANVASSVVLEGLKVTVTNTGTTNTNTALVLTASGGSTANIALDITAGLMRTASTISLYNNVAAVGMGVPPIYGSAKQTAVSAAGNVLSFTPPAETGTYRLTFALDVSAATAATLGWTATWTDSAGNAQAPTNLSLEKNGAVPALTFVAVANDTYSGSTIVNVNNSATAIVVKVTFAGTSFAGLASATIERLN